MGEALTSGKSRKTFSAVIEGCVTVTVVLISSFGNRKSASRLSIGMVLVAFALLGCSAKKDARGQNRHLVGKSLAREASGTKSPASNSV